MKKTQLSASLARAQQARCRTLFDVVDQDTEHAFLTLQAGRMPEGWDLYESRWKSPGWLIKPSFLPPDLEWTGETFHRKTLLLYYEQGFGDMFQFIRYASMVKARGGQVLLACHQAQADVLETCPGVDEVWPVIHGRPVPTPGFDLHFPVCSLPRIFRTDLQSIPAPIPYLDVPQFVPNIVNLGRLLGTPGQRMRIGCAWFGHPNHPNNNLRSIALEVFASLGQIEADWFAFQYGMGSTVPFPGMTPLAPMLSTFSDTALALTAMDLVITVDTSLAHLAGAMGIPCWLLLSIPLDWRWLLGRSDTPWYPSMRLFRQPHPGDWKTVVEDVIQAFDSEFGRGAA